MRNYATILLSIFVVAGCARELPGVEGADAQPSRDATADTGADTGGHDAGLDAAPQDATSPNDSAIADAGTADTGADTGPASAGRPDSSPPDAGGAGLTCACGGAYALGDRIEAAVNNPQDASLLEGHRGTVAAAKGEDLPLLIEWDDWSSGHGGNCDRASGLCTSCETEGVDRWWVECTDIREVP